MPRNDRFAGEPAHDVLAAEEFGVPAPDPLLHHGPVELPDDPSGIPEAHDVLAAEEFAMPAPAVGARFSSLERRGRPAPGLSVAAGAAVVLLLGRVRRARRRRRPAAN